MFEKEAMVKLTLGLQARSAAQFAHQASQFDAEITIFNNSKKANAKSVMGLMSLALRKGTKVRIQAEGPDEEQAVQELIAFIENEEA